MNINFIISLSLFRIFLFENKLFYFIDGVENNITHTNNQNYDDYYFYTRVNQSKIVKFTAKTPNSCKLSSSLEISESDYKIINDKNYYVYNFEGKMINNMCVYYYSYNISSSRTIYVSFGTRIHEQSSYTKINITIRIDLAYEEYELDNRQALTIFDLSFNNSYYLYLEYFETIDISFIINNMTQKPFSKIIIHEFESRKNTSIIRINKQISFEKKNNQSIASFSYSASSNYTKYMALQIKPSQNISQMSAKYEYSVTTFDLNEGLWEAIDNLITNKTYIFFTEATETAKINISIIINNTGNENDEYDEYELPIIFNNGTIIQPYPKKETIPNYIDINLYEYEKKNNSYNTYFQKNAKRLNKERDIYFMTKNYIKVNSSNTTYLAFSFKPNFNINHMRVNINISGGLFDLLNNTSKNMFNLRPDNDYYFFIEAHQFYFIRLTLTMNNYMNLTTIPFHIYIITS